MTADSALRVLTFYILCDKRTDSPYAWTDRREHVFSLLRRYAPDIFCLQEVLSNQMDELMEAFPDYDAFGVGRNDGERSGEAVPIFCRRDALETLNEGGYWLSATPDVPGSIGWDAKRPRTAVWKRLRRISGEIFFMVNTHYDNIGKTANENSAALISRRLGSGPEPVILCGDFNSPQDSPAYNAILSNGFRDAAGCAGITSEGPPFTYHKFFPIESERNDRVFRTIDHIFIRGEMNPVSRRVIDDHSDGVYPSDHFPVLCDFDRSWGE